MQPINLIGGFYKDDALPWSVQDTVNLLPVAAEVDGTRTPTKLRTPPGLRPFVNIGDGPDYAIRGMHDVEGALFVVSGSRLYRISNTGVAIPCGTIPGVGRVSMAHNQITGGNELLVVNGDAGYVWNTVTETFARVSDEGYPGAFIADYIDSYLAQVEPFGRYWFHSDLADAMSYNTLDRAESEAAPDRIVSLLSAHLEVWVFGERTIEVFENVGAGTGTFQNKRVAIEHGCAGRFTPAKLDNGIFWLGNDGVVYRANGYQPQRISTHAIERAIADSDWSQAFAFTWSDRGHAVYYLTFPDGQTWGYDVSSGLWHRRATYHPQYDVARRWRLNDLVYSNRQWIGGDYRDGKLYALDWDYVLEGEGDPLVRERVAQVLQADQRRFSVNEVELVMESGGATVAGVQFPYQPKGPTIEGDAPDGYIGQAYSFQYTITQGDAEIVSVAATSEIPKGLTLTNSGLLSGMLEESGRFNFSVRVTDANGLWDEVIDSIFVSSAWALMEVGEAPDPRVWISGNPMSWPDLKTMTPYVSDIGYATGNVAPLALAVVSNVHDSIVRGSLPATGPNLITAQASIGAGVSRIRRFGDISFAFGTDSSTYYYSTDGGASWSSVPVPGGLRIWDIARIDSSGRWVSHLELDADSRMVYSDQEIPTTWETGQAGLEGARSYPFASDGKTIMAMGSGRRFYRTKDGESWDVLGGAVGSFYVDPRDGQAFGDTFIFAGQTGSLGNIIVSNDGGDAWQGVTIPDLVSIERLERDGEIWVASGEGRVTPSDSLVYVSTDRGATWLPSSMPFSVGSNMKAVAVSIKP